MGLFSKKQETLNERIKKLRKEKGWTQLKLAEQLNITDKAVKVNGSWRMQSRYYFITKTG